MEMFPIQSSPTCYALNLSSLGDTIAAVPVVKWAIDNYHASSGNNYLVCVSNPSHRVLLPFVPYENFISLPNLPASYVLKTLFETGPWRREEKLDQRHMSLSDFAAVRLVGRILTEKDYQYINLPEVTIDKFPMPDKSRWIVMPITSMGNIRTWKEMEILSIAEWLLDKGFIPVLVGNSQGPDSRRLFSKNKIPQGCLDICDQTTLLELATIIKRSRIVVGIDGGIIHLAGTTGTPIVCGFTNIEPHLRKIPGYKENKFVPVEIPKHLGCRYCVSRFNAQHLSPDVCHMGYKDPKCVLELTAERFIQAIKHMLG